MDLKNRIIHTSFLLVICLTLSWSGRICGEENAVDPVDTPGKFLLEWYPRDVAPGDIVKIVINGSAGNNVFAEGSLGEQELIFHAIDSGNDLFSIGGIDLEYGEKTIPLTVIIRSRDGKADRLRNEVRVMEREFSVQKLYIEEKEYTPERLERIGREKEMFTSLWETVTPDRFWQESFLQPLPVMTLTSDFGLQRFINDVPRKPHTGVDLRAATGDTIFATNRGQVALSGDFYFNGKSIVLNHGEGFYSMYFHLSGFLVEEGEIVGPGEPIGLIGSSGRSTAPHLHWGIILRGARLDPLKLLELPIEG